MKKVIAAAALCAATAASAADGKPAAADNRRLVSPDGRNAIILHTAPLRISVERDGKKLAGPFEIGMTIDGKNIAAGCQTPEAVRDAVSTGSEKSPVYKKSALDLTKNGRIFDFGEWSVELAARDDGVAYRFVTDFKKKAAVQVDGEEFSLRIPDDARCWTHYTWSPGMEEVIPVAGAAKDVETAGRSRRMIYLPFVYKTAGKTVAVTESDVYDYPVLNMTRTKGAAVFQSFLAGWPLDTVLNGLSGQELLKSRKRKIEVKTHAPWLVRTAPVRTYPWRVFAIADKPARLMEADIVNALARPARKGADFSWVKPGKVAWDWWNCWNLQGVPFKAGCNTRSYEYFIDFAAKNGVEYVIFDEGWSEHLNIWKNSKNVDVPHLIKYARKRGVGIILWMAWAQVYGQEEKVAAHFAKLGAKGFKVDFMDRGDADCERFLWKLAAACARHKLVLDYHGAHRPTGMSRAFPNVLNYEGIHGLEQMKWFRGDDKASAVKIGNDVAACFLRLSAGPMDYTPGAMDNYPVGPFKCDGRDPGAMGTRCRQIAMMALYEAPLQMLCDSPTKYEKNMECVKFMLGVPVVWGDVRGLGGDPDTFAAAARKTQDGSAWYAAGINNAEGRDIEFSTSFLEKGEWQAEIFCDAPDSDENPRNYIHKTKTMKGGAKVVLHMAKGGGFAIKFTKKK